VFQLIWLSFNSAAIYSFQIIALFLLDNQLFLVKLPDWQIHGFLLNISKPSTFSNKQLLYLISTSLLLTTLTTWPFIYPAFKFTKWEVDPSMVEDLPVASLKVFKDIDNVCVNTCFRLKPSIIFLALQQVHDPHDWNPTCFMWSPFNNFEKI